MLRPDNKMMQNNFQHFSKNSEFKLNELIDYEEKVRRSLSHFFDIKKLLLKILFLSLFIGVR